MCDVHAQQRLIELIRAASVNEALEFVQVSTTLCPSLFPSGCSVAHAPRRTGNVARYAGGACVSAYDRGPERARAGGGQDEMAALCEGNTELLAHLENTLALLAFDLDVAPPAEAAGGEAAAHRT